MIQRSYSCSDQALYAVANLGWQSFLQQTESFSEFKAKYNPAFGQSRLAEVAAAQALPGVQAREAQTEILRIQLESNARFALSTWQRLKRYITDAFDPAMQKPNLEAAGQNFYAKAGRNEWSSVTALMQNGSSFIDNNSSALQDNENMPATFQTTFDSAKNSFIENHQSFMASEQSTKIATETKALANNEVHAKLMAMFLDGQELFKDNEALKKQFVFEQVLMIATGTGSAGLKGYVTDEGTENPIVGATVSLLPTGKTATTDEEGKYTFTQLVAQDYAVTITADGYQQFNTDQTINVGTTSTLNVVLEPLPVPVV